MKRIHIMVAVCVVSATVQINASAQTWSNESTNLRGVEIGTDFSSTYKECPKRQRPYLKEAEYWPEYDQNYPAEFKGTPCFKVTKRRPIMAGITLYEIHNLVFIKGAGASVEVSLIDNRVEAIELEFLNENRDFFYEAMVDKYGKPSFEETKVYQNAFGTKFFGRSLRWQGNTVTLTYDELIPGSKPEWGIIRMHSQAFLRKIGEWGKDSRQQIRKGL